jgi:hypothetical protein
MQILDKIQFKSESAEACNSIHPLDGRGTWF